MDIYRCSVVFCLFFLREKRVYVVNTECGKLTSHTQARLASQTVDVRLPILFHILTTVVPHIVC